MGPSISPKSGIGRSKSVSRKTTDSVRSLDFDDLSTITLVLLKEIQDRKTKQSLNKNVRNPKLTSTPSVVVWKQIEEKTPKLREHP